MKDKNNVTRPRKGLHTDASPQDQPKDTYRFGLNAIGESKNGDGNFVGNEESNEVCAPIPVGYVPLGKVYIGRGKTVIFSVKSDESLSEIGIADDECNYETHVNFNLGFKVSKQIDATYRLRRGCERTIYFTDGENKPRVYNFDKPEDFKDSLGAWDIDKFDLFRTYNKIPAFNKVEISESGQLLAGSYNFSIQYLDEDLNPTEWITTTDTVIIYNDNPTSKAFAEIRGSTNKETAYQNFGVTNKAIKLTLGNLDTSFPFYRIGIIEANDGSGQVSRVVYSSEVPTSIKSYTYSGGSAFTEGTEEEIQQFNTVITSAKHIEQIENILVLSNTKGKQLDFCRLQKYASKIKAELVLQEVILNDIETVDNQKRGQLNSEKVGYMPGEIYSFGIVYVFEDGTLSPVYHIPGRNPTFYSQMSTDNKLTNLYTDNNNCSIEDYWGVDSQGDTLVNKPIRHHRFPLRSTVNEPLFTKNGSFGNPSTITTWGLHVKFTGSFDPLAPDTIYYRVDYTVDTVPYSVIKTIHKSTYDPLVGLEVLIVSTLGTIANVVIGEIDITTGGPASILSGLIHSYTIDIIHESTSTDDNSIYTSKIFGIKFSGIDVPLLSDTNEEKIVGYYIVRNERTEETKTILDSGVICPLIEETGTTTTELKFVAHGHLMPNISGSRIKDDIFALIHPEHRFSNREYTNVTQYLQEGEYVVQSKNLAQKTLQDVQPGTSYDASIDKKSAKDTDGFSLHMLSRNHTVDYVQSAKVFAKNLDATTDIIEEFYLDTLFSKTVTDTGGVRKDVFNVSADNKIGIVQLNKTVSLDNKLPYVIMKRVLDNPYAEFRVLPYYKETSSLSPMTNPTGNNVTIFNGDSYISPMKYMSSMYYDTRVPDPDETRKTGLLNYILGVAAIIGGVAIAVLTEGIGTGIGIAVAGFGVSQISTGIKKSQMAKVYQDLYEQGLHDTIDDNDTSDVFGPDPSDDTIQWFHDSITNLWFESNVNTNWRMGATIGITDFLNSPTGFDEEHMLQYCTDKLTTPDIQNDDGRTYQGYAKAELYELNPDYRRRDKQKIFYHLGLEYDCCSKCIEDFPQRNHYSEQSFQEELTDNYRKFLPNNYRDMEGGTGKITNTFRIKNNLYIQTEEALWHLPQNIQERITGEVTSFIGTGSFFSIPPRKILDDNTGNSGGCQHKWSVLKTPHGIFFVSENQGIVYQFDGAKLKPISYAGMFNWFKNKIPVRLDKDYYSINQRLYPYRDNPSNEFGSGFISTYDSRHERIILTKKDFLFNPDLSSMNTDTNLDSSYKICIKDGIFTLFSDYNSVIATQENNGWEYVGIENCQMKFKKVVQVEKSADITTTTPNATDLHIFYDMSLDAAYDTRTTCMPTIEQAIVDWEADFGLTHPDWTGSVYTYEDESERWLNPGLTSFISGTYGGNTSGKDIIIIPFWFEANDVYHGATLDTSISAPTSIFNSDYLDFTTNVYPIYNSVKGIIYPIVIGNGSTKCDGSGTVVDIVETRNFFLHTVAALWGTPMTPTEFTSEFLNVANPGFTAAEWNTFLGAIQGANPYNDNGLKDFGWTGKWDRYLDPTGSIITPSQFNQDINDYLKATVTTVTTNVIVDEVQYLYIDGTHLTNPPTLNNSWSISYSLKSNPNSWQSLHSYLPNFYINTPEHFQSWNQGWDSLWKHNKKGNYQNFYGSRYPFIIEFVSLSNPLLTKVWDYLRFITEAKRYDPTFDEYLDERFITFDKGLFYNSRQTSGILNLMVKDTNDDDTNYLLQQVKNLAGDTIIIDRNERDWTLNELRDARVLNNNALPVPVAEPMFNSDLESLQNDYYIDKIVNTNIIDTNKDWTQLESFRDKYLIIRLIFDTFDDVKLILNYSVENEKQSFR